MRQKGVPVHSGAASLGFLPVFPPWWKDKNPAYSQRFGGTGGGLLPELEAFQGIFGERDGEGIGVFIESLPQKEAIPNMKEGSRYGPKTVGGRIGQSCRCGDSSGVASVDRRGVGTDEAKAGQAWGWLFPVDGRAGGIGRIAGQGACRVFVGEKRGKRSCFSGQSLRVREGPLPPLQDAESSCQGQAGQAANQGDPPQNPCR